jgi:VWFA-related protein
VLVPVVVRDKHGQPVGKLTKDDFQLFDNGRRQAIFSFSALEHAKDVQASDAAAVTPANGPEHSERAKSTGENNNPKRSFIYLFDDLNIRFAAMANIRAAAVRHFKNNLAAGDRVAIYTFSGNPTLEFTSDRENLEGAVSKLRWRPPAGRGEMQCPDVSYYIADLILIKGDDRALQGLTNHTVECAHVPPDVARNIAVAAANRELIMGVQYTKVAPADSKACDPAAGRNARRALHHTGVARLLCANTVMKDLAEGTGGTFFHNNNLDTGFERVTAAPEFSYVLGFSPGRAEDGRELSFFEGPSASRERRQHRGAARILCVRPSRKTVRRRRMSTTQFSLETRLLIFPSSSKPAIPSPIPAMPRKFWW